jgi:hypothetical protein
MSTHLTQHQIETITGCVRQSAQERRLRNMGYIVLDRNAKNEVQALSMHPRDPQLKLLKIRGEHVVLNLR